MKKRNKRENGSGTICYRAERKNKKWVVFAPAAIVWSEKEGKAKTTRKQIGSYATYEEAKTALKAFLVMPSPRYNMTLQDAYDEWSGRFYAKQDTGAGTVKVYTAAWKKVPEYLRRMKMRDIRTAMYQQVIDDNADMSASTLNNIKIVLKACCEYAEQNDVIAKNYASFVELPKKEKAEKEAFSELELEKISRAVGVVPGADLIYLMCDTGFRISEILALTPFSYDREQHTLTGGMKTNAGKNRVVPLVDPVSIQIVESLLQKGGETIICREDGRPWTYYTFVPQVYYPALEAIGVRKLTPHACRHTAITRAAKADVRPEAMMAKFGHASYDIEAKTYIHPDAAMMEAEFSKVK